MRWTGATERRRIKDALAYWQQLTCVTFTENSKAPFKLLFVKQSGLVVLHSQYNRNLWPFSCPWLLKTVCKEFVLRLYLFLNICFLNNFVPSENAISHQTDPTHHEISRKRPDDLMRLNATHWSCPDLRWTDVMMSDDQQWNCAANYSALNDRFRS